MTVPDLTPDQVAEKLGVSGRTVRRWCKTGRLAYYALGQRTLRIRQLDLEAFLKDNRQSKGGVARRRRRA
ncbi:helix-turn-helix domain-containing protein [Planctomycetota bacterium]